MAGSASYIGGLPTFVGFGICQSRGPRTPYNIGSGGLLVLCPVFIFILFVFLMFLSLPSPLPFVILGGTCLPTCLPCVATRTAGRRESWELSDAVRCSLRLATHSFGPLFRLDGRPGWARPGQSAGHALAIGSSGHWGAWWPLSSWGHPCPVSRWLPAYTPFASPGASRGIFPGVRPPLVGLHYGWRGEEVKVIT